MSSPTCVVHGSANKARVPCGQGTKKQRIKDRAELGDNKDSQTKTDVEVPGQPAEPI